MIKTFELLFGDSVLEEVSLPDQDKSHEYHPPNMNIIFQEASQPSSTMLNDSINKG